VRTAIIAWIPELPPDVGAAPSPAEASPAAEPRGDVVPAGGTQPTATIVAGAAGPHAAAAVAGVAAPRNADDHPRDASAEPRLDAEPRRDAVPQPPIESCRSAAAASPSPAALPLPAAARSVPRPRFTPARFPSGSIAVLALVSAAVWGMAWRNEHVRLEAQRRGPERLARQPAEGTAATGSIRP